jgi:hypothetical protein
MHFCVQRTPLGAEKSGRLKEELEIKNDNILKVVPPLYSEYVDQFHFKNNNNNDVTSFSCQRLTTLFFK